jgi:hypothetical protein
MVKIYRMAQVGSSKGKSPSRELYGRKGDNTLLAPLDICKFSIIGGVEVLQSGDFQGFTVNASGAVIGTIRKHDDFITGTVSPIVEIEPSDGVMDSIASLPDTSTEAKVTPSVGDKVTLEVFELGSLVRRNVIGTIKEAVELRRYGLLTTNVQAYKVEFQQDITSINIGARVVPLTGTGIIGMLITTKDLPSPGGAVSLVYPATLI